jgi:ZIP family zinc transporter
MREIYIILAISALGPVIGSLIGVWKKPKESFMYIMLAFAAGVMLAISFLELIPESIKLSSIPIAGLGIILGALLMYTLDKTIPHIHPELGTQEPGQKLKRTAVYLMAGIFLHNFPEGMAMATGAVSDFSTTLAIALAIAIHNIPEGICTSAPYYAVTGKRLKSFLLSSSTAIPIVVGFLFASYLFTNIPLKVVGLIVGATAGLMIYISGDELIPTSCNKCNKNWSHATIFSLLAGVLFVLFLKLL